MRTPRSAENLERFRQVFEKSPNAYLLLAPDFTILACNEAYERHVGRLREHLVGRPLFDVFPVANPAQRQRLQASLAWVFRERRRHTLPLMRYPVAHVATLANDDHAGRFWTVTHVPILNAAGEVECILSHPADIAELTRLRRADAEAATPAALDPVAVAASPASQWVSGMQQLSGAERQYLQQLFKQAPGFVCVLQGPQHRVELANDAFYQLIGHRSVQGHELARALPEVVEQGFLAKLDAVLATGQPQVGRAIPLSLQREKEGPLEPRYIDLVFQPIREADDTVSGIFVQGHDVTDAHELAQALAYQAAHDPLTGLLNRREFAARVEAMLERGPQPPAAGPSVPEPPAADPVVAEPFALPQVPVVPMIAEGSIDVARDANVGTTGRHVLLYFDLDQFKIVNDQWGHAAGDELLRQVAALLQHKVRTTDILARLGGDEFALVLCDCPPDAALRVAQQLRQAIDALVFLWQGQRYGVSLSVGLVAFGPALGLGFELALSHADAACFLAKEKGRNRIQVFHPADDELHRRHREMGWVARLHDCLAQDRVVLYAQRIVPMQPGLGAELTWELLARLQEPDGSLVLPAAFIPAAERFGLMPALDRHILRKVFAHLHHLPAPLRKSTRYFVNVSGSTLNQEDLPRFVQSLLATYPRVLPQQVCFEVTETAAVSNLAATACAMQQLVDQGFRFALDDFGSGMASFAYLRQLPVQYVKIDGEFVRDILSDPVDDAMVQAVAKVARTMGIQTVAEFVESRAIQERLLALGVDYGQGFGLDYPRPLAEVLADPVPPAADDQPQPVP